MSEHHHQHRRDHEEDLAYGEDYGQSRGYDDQREGSRSLVGDVFNKVKSRVDKYGRPHQSDPYGYGSSSSSGQQQQYGQSYNQPYGQSDYQGQYQQQTQTQYQSQNQPPYTGGPPPQSSKPNQKPDIADKLFGSLTNAVQSIGTDVAGLLGTKYEPHHQSYTAGTQGPQGQFGAQGAGAVRNRFDSFVHERNGNDVKWFVDGCAYFWAVSEALERARESVWILDWWLSPELYLRRPPAANEEWRLDRVLQRIANRGVKINVIVYKEVTEALTLSSVHTKHALEALSPNIAVFRHPDHHPDAQTAVSSITSTLQGLRLDAAGHARQGADTLRAAYGFKDGSILYWAHHEKLCLIDQKIAFMGGLDLCYGRWDTNQHSISDAHPSDLNKIVFPGQDFNNARVMDFDDVSRPFQNKLDRTKSSRMGWSDVSICLRGACVKDLRHHFTDRWNFIYDEKYNVHKDIRYARLPIVSGHSATEGPQPAPVPGSQQNLQPGQFAPPPGSQNYTQPPWQATASAHTPASTQQYGSRPHTPQQPMGQYGPGSQQQYGSSTQNPQSPSGPYGQGQQQYGSSAQNPQTSSGQYNPNQQQYGGATSNPQSSQTGQYGPGGQNYGAAAVSPQTPSGQYNMQTTFPPPPPGPAPQSQQGYGSQQSYQSGQPQTTSSSQQPSQASQPQYGTSYSHPPPPQPPQPPQTVPSAGYQQQQPQQPTSSNYQQPPQPSTSAYQQPSQPSSGYSQQPSGTSGYPQPPVSGGYQQPQPQSQTYSQPQIQPQTQYGSEHTQTSQSQSQSQHPSYPSPAPSPQPAPAQYSAYHPPQQTGQTSYAQELPSGSQSQQQYGPSGTTRGLDDNYGPSETSRGMGDDFGSSETSRGFGQNPDYYGDERGGGSRGRFDKYKDQGKLLGSELGNIGSMIGHRVEGKFGSSSGRPGSSHHSGGPMQCQLIRSCTNWSNGTPTEHSVQNAYIDVIMNSKHFIYIENQFFITATGDKQGPVKNQIGRALVDRILRAARNRERYHVIVVMPAVPAFAGDFVEDASLGTRAICEFQYNSICRGGNSIMELIANAGFNPMDYIRFYNLRTYDRINFSATMMQAQSQSGVGYEQARMQQEQALGAGYAGQGYQNYSQAQQGYTGYSGNPAQQYQGAAAALPTQAADRWDTVASCYMLGGQDIRTVPWSGPPEAELDAFVSEELYIHSKLMIADDRVVICGSANINDRSMLGYHDSEIALLINDSTPIQGSMAGQQCTVSRFAASLRRQLTRKHLGLIPAQDFQRPDDNFLPLGPPNLYDWGSPEDRVVADPLSDTFLSLWNTRARTNTEVYRKAFRAVPDDYVRTWGEYKEFYEYYFHRADVEAAGKDRNDKRPSRVEYGHVVREDFPGGVKELKEQLVKVKGTVVEMPLCFLQNENIAKQGLTLNALTEEIYT